MTLKRLRMRKLTLGYGLHQATLASMPVMKAMSRDISSLSLSLYTKLQNMKVWKACTNSWRSVIGRCGNPAVCLQTVNTSVKIPVTSHICLKLTQYHYCSNMLDLHACRRRNSTFVV